LIILFSPYSIRLTVIRLVYKTQFDYFVGDNTNKGFIPFLILFLPLLVLSPKASLILMLFLSDPSDNL
jgi:hypothetical protein